MARRFIHRVLPLVLAAASAPGCSRQTTASLWSVRSGPIIGNELIVGRVLAEGAVWIATGTDGLVRVDVERGTFTQSHIRTLMPGEHVWGLASTAPGELWTLIGRNVLGQI